STEFGGPAPAEAVWLHGDRGTVRGRRARRQPYGRAPYACPPGARPVRRQVRAGEGNAMNETMVCVVGNVATQPVYRETATGPAARFRIAVTARYWGREKGTWTDGHTNFFTVWANRQLATNTAD